MVSPASEGDREQLTLTDLQESWRLLTPEERLEAFDHLDQADAEDFFLELPARDQIDLLARDAAPRRRSWMRLLPPDDAADVIQEADESDARRLLRAARRRRRGARSPPSWPTPRTTPAAS